ncbi:hypothetical protein NDU88_004503 [Pleurodeles waltl]|uniref:Uncharacterized protein n=1 Tax=Pleurodeles waltl TaxID=8319 RepID=A0AAV7PFW0_PLEWA|nr:hypothetical protein NDU88_004503 [Pleurodeles waltl]
MALTDSRRTLAMQQAPVRALSLEPGKGYVVNEGPMLISTGVDAGCSVDGREEQLFDSKYVADRGLVMDTFAGGANKEAEKGKAKGGSTS